MILQYDAGRLLFVMKVAAQLEKSALRPAFIPSYRLITNTVLLTSNILQIHLTILGSRTYISRLEDPIVVKTRHIPGTLEPMRFWQPSMLPEKDIANTKKTFKIRYKDFKLNDEKYLAIRSDGVGIIDLAFRHFNKMPDWILNTTTRPFEAKIAEIRQADISRLIVISDSDSSTYTINFARPPTKLKVSIHLGCVYNKERVRVQTLV
ncbi:hypothetical protein N7478_004829 [Penicillium angulare]|uniref:uncharacterized protein n=1 Tax=Penicillium angulare TaxID=116970 RepID=UPI002540333F|nr:uncharacterized protein N7478_004829 [Penicillium angulare]KAJ5279457.1 hypothetical protein N7478_004829 [Penicillium angulare]